MCYARLGEDRHVRYWKEVYDRHVLSEKEPSAG
jgi:hypothetical protein